MIMNLCVDCAYLQLNFCVFAYIARPYCTHAGAYFCLFAHGSQADTRAYVHAHSCILVYMPTCMHACIILHTYIHTYIHTYLHTYIRTYVHTELYRHTRKTNNEFATVTCMSMLTHPQMYIHIHNLLYACLFAHMLTKLHECVRLITPAHKHNLSRSGEICTHTHPHSLSFTL